MSHRRIGRMGRLATALLIAAVLAACSSAPRTSSRSSTVRRATPPAPVPPLASPASPGDRDGPEPHPPPGLALVPNAEPRVEFIRVGGPNKPYAALGLTYTPMTEDEPLRERGLASWYGRKFHGRRTSSGELYNMYAMTAAHPTLPIPSYARVTNPKNGHEVIVRINDRGPFSRNRVIDLSYTAALKLDILRGVTEVEVERLTHDMIRTGSWRRDTRSGGEAYAQAEEAPAAVAVAVMPSTEAPDALVTPAVPTTPEPGAVPIPAPAMAPEPATPRLESLPDSRAGTVAARGWWLQLGAFSQRESAALFQRRLAEQMDALAPMLALFNEKPLHKIQAGPYPSREEAQAAAQTIRTALQLVPMLVQRR